MAARRFTFWLGVAGVAVLADFGLALAAAHFPGSGIAALHSFKTGASA